MTKKPKRKRMGRPPVAPDKKLGVRLTVPMTDAMWAELEATAAARGVTPTDIVRERITAGAVKPEPEQS